MTSPAPASPAGIPTAAGIAAAVRRREVSALEVTEAHLERIERVNPRVNALTVVFASRSRAPPT